MQTAFTSPMSFGFGKRFGIYPTPGGAEQKFGDSPNKLISPARGSSRFALLADRLNVFIELPGTISHRPELNRYRTREEVRSLEQTLSRIEGSIFPAKSLVQVIGP